MFLDAVATLYSKTFFCTATSLWLITDLAVFLNKINEIEAREDSSRGARFFPGQYRLVELRSAVCPSAIDKLLNPKQHCELERGDRKSGGPHKMADSDRSAAFPSPGRALFCFFYLVLLSAGAPLATTAALRRASRPRRQSLKRDADGVFGRWRSFCRNASEERERSSV